MIDAYVTIRARPLTLITLAAHTAGNGVGVYEAVLGYGSTNCAAYDVYNP